jgi:hypothetical protein
MEAFASRKPALIDVSIDPYDGNDDDDVYLMNYNIAMGYKIYLHTNPDQPEQHKYKTKSIRKIYS